jgi:hypothetical protein
MKGGCDNAGGIMSAYRDALHIEIDASPARMELAAALLRRNEGTVVLSERIALRSEPQHILCEVIVDARDTLSSAEEYASLVDAARELLTTSTLGRAIAKRKLEWVVVADDGVNTIELWKAG